MFWIVFVFFLHAICDEDDFSFGDSVDIITSSNVDSILDSHEFYLIFFYEFSPYSQQASMIIDSFSKEFDGVGVVNCRKHGDVCSRFSVGRVPVLKLFKDGEDYRIFLEDLKSTSQLSEWTKLSSRPLLQEIETYAQFKDLHQQFPKHSILVKIFHPNFDEDSNLSLFAKAFDEFVVVKINKVDGSEKLLKKFRLSREEKESIDPIFYVYKFWNKRFKKMKYTDNLSERDSLAEELMEKGFPIISEANTASLERMSKISDLVCLLFYKKDEYSKEEEEKLFEPIIETSKSLSISEVSFGSCDQKNDFFKIYTNIGGFEEELPNMGCFDQQRSPNTRKRRDQKPGRYIFKGDIYDSEDLLYFVQKILKGEGKESLRSEKIPAQDEPVYKVVGSTYEQILHSNPNFQQKDVLLMLYQASPDMNVKQKYEKEYEEFAKETSLFTKTLLVAKMDLGKNDIPNEQDQQQIRGIPTVLLFQGINMDDHDSNNNNNNNARKPIVFDRELTIENLKKFLQKKGKASKKDIDNKYNEEHETDEL